MVVKISERRPGEHPEVIVDRRRGRLNEKHFRTSYRLVEAYPDFSVRELAQKAQPGRSAQLPAATAAASTELPVPEKIRNALAIGYRPRRIQVPKRPEEHAMLELMDNAGEIAAHDRAFWCRPPS